MSSELVAALDHLGIAVQHFSGRREHVWVALRSLGPVLQAAPDAIERIAPPESIRQLWARDLRATRARNVLQLSNLARAILILRGGGIEPLVFKGADAAERLYPDLGMRPMDDVDILVRRSERLRAISLLSESGFVAIPNEPGRFGPANGRIQAEVTFRTNDEGARSEIDLHWHTVADARLRAGFPGIDDDAVWDRTSACVVGGIQSLRLGDIDAAIVQALSQVVGHPWSHPLGYLDLHLLVQEWTTSDWDDLSARVRDRNLSVPVFWALHFAARLFGTRVPASIVSRLEPSRMNRMLARLLIRGDYLGFAPYRREMAARDQFVLTAAQPNGAFRMIRHGLFGDRSECLDVPSPSARFASARAYVSHARNALGTLARGAAR